jgi:nitroreductase
MSRIQTQNWSPQMNVLDAVNTRRAVKHFDPNHRLTAEEEKTILHAAIQAPTSFNIQHWRFVILRDPELRAKIRKEYGNDQAQITDASLLILMTADTKAWQKDPARYWANAPKPVSDLLVGWMAPFHEGREWLQRDEAQRSIGMAMQTIMLVAKELGYDSCPMIGFDIDAVAKLINLPPDHVMGPMIAIGRKTKDVWPKPGQLPLDQVVVENHF